MSSQLRRVARWGILVVILIEIVLVRGRFLTTTTAVAVAAAFESMTILLGSLQAIRATRRIIRGRRAGADIWDALTDGLTVFVPRPIARVIALEPRIWVSLFVWLLRRPRPNATTFPYAANSVIGILTIAILFSAPVEMLLAELLVPWGWLRLVLIVLEIYTIVWLLGFGASLSVLPHRLTSDALILHYGLLLDVPLPYANIATITYERRSSMNGREGHHFVAQRCELALVVGGMTNVRVTLYEAQTFMGIMRRTPPVQTILLKVNEPEGFVAAVAERLSPSPISVV